MAKALDCESCTGQGPLSPTAAVALLMEHCNCLGACNAQQVRILSVCLLLFLSPFAASATDQAPGRAAVLRCTVLMAPTFLSGVADATVLTEESFGKRSPAVSGGRAPVGLLGRIVQAGRRYSRRIGRMSLSGPQQERCARGNLDKG